MCNSLLEAMLLGVPVVARANAGNAGLIAHDESGLLFDDADGMVQCARRLVSEPQTAARLAEGAQRVVARGHSERAEVDAYEAALEAALSS